jgi:hypothetical protein
MALRAPREIAQSEPSVVRRERAINKQTVQELLLAAVQKFADAKLSEVSDPTKLEAAYDTVLFCALAVFASQGYRVSSAPGHHKLALEGLAATLKLKQSVFDEILLLLDVRNTKYTGFLRVRPADLKLAQSLAEKALNETTQWIAVHNPDLLKKP